MALPKISEVRELTDEQLSEEIVAVKKQLFQLRLQKATRQLDKPHQFKHARHRLSQLLTVENERKRASSSQPTEEPAKESE
jgi:large subunit ribosomal protein L29